MRALCRFFLLFISLSFGYFLPAGAQNISNEGTEFWAVFPTHDPSQGQPADMSINVTSKFESEVTVSCNGWSSLPTRIPANQVVTFIVPRVNSYVNANEANKELVNRAIHILVTPGKPKVVAYCHVYAGNRSAATLILPYEALGQEYYSMNFTQDKGDGQSKGFLTLVATDDDTKLILRRKDGSTTDIPTLNKGDVYEYMPDSQEDLTGVFVTVADEASKCKRFAAFSGSTSIGIVCPRSRDPLLQQLYSLANWGKTYGVIPFFNRRYILRVLAQENATSILVDGVQVAVKDKGDYYESDILTNPAVVTANKAVSVAQYALGQSCSSLTGGILTGDPEMVLLNPAEFNIKNITVFSSNEKAIKEKYVNVFMKTARTSSFKLNGVVPSSSWNVVPSDPSYSYIQIQVFDESLTLTADDGFNAIAYGFGDTESYAYSAGTNLAASQPLTFYNRLTLKPTYAACIGQPLDLKLTLTYQLSRLIWKYDDNIIYDDETPTPEVQILNGQNFYIYTAPVNMVFNVNDSKTITASATLLFPSPCATDDNTEFNFTFDIEALPIAKFDIVGNFCSNNQITFIDKSTANDKRITKWFWDFGDGEFSEEENPKHAYRNTGIKRVKLYVGSESGCLSEVVEMDITINPTPVASFLTSIVKCSQSDITFTDNSSIESGSIVKWCWDFGDPTSPSNISSLQNPNHRYASPGTFHVILTVESDKGCVNSYPLDLIVNDLPKVDFVIPDVCLRDAQAVFDNKSTDFDGAVTDLKYLWDFGEPTSGVLNASTDRDGKHKYSATGDYTVTLIVTNRSGCTFSSSKLITINGSEPKANFEVMDIPNCSNKLLRLKSKASVSPGRITKVQWFIDGEKQGEDDLSSLFDKEYTFPMVKFASPLSKLITVKMVVFSGEACSDEFSQDVTLHASPDITFNQPTAICLNKEPVQLVATEINGLTGEFSGVGVTSAGIFDPKMAGVGPHVINYKVVTDKGCEENVTRTIEVLPIPVIDVPDVVYVLAGGQVEIPAVVEGTNMTYKWSPALGLNRDDVLNPIASPEKDTEYTITGTNDLLCSVTAKVLVKVLDGVTIPNSFSPNGDSVNDFWNIKYLETYPKATVEVFSRNGTRVFFSTGYKNPFDGNYQNQQLPVGVYYYIVDPKNGRKRLTGSVTIIR